MAMTAMAAAATGAATAASAPNNGRRKAAVAPSPTAEPAVALTPEPSRPLARASPMSSAVSWTPNRPCRMQSRPNCWSGRQRGGRGGRRGWRRQARAGPDADAPKLQKVLAQAGIASRRDMSSGSPTVASRSTARWPTWASVSFGDQVKVNGKPVRFRISPPTPRILAYHKPTGEVSTFHDPEGRLTVFRTLPRIQGCKWQSVGRLGHQYRRLLLFTNSGELANQLMHPRFGVERGTPRACSAR